MSSEFPMTNNADSSNSNVVQNNNSTDCTTVVKTEHSTNTNILQNNNSTDCTTVVKNEVLPPNDDKPQKNKKQLVICLTGPMAAGKNAAADILEKHGFISIDADKCVHKAIENSKDLIIKTFGEIAEKNNISIVNEDGTINRKALGSILFSDKKLLAKQEAIVHPAVENIMYQFIKEHPESDIILNATVLYKTPIIKQCNAIIFIDAPALLRLKRAQSRDSLSKKHILQRFLSQFKIFTKYKKTKSDIYRVWNNATHDELEKNLLEVVHSIRLSEK